jgi:hypothetical protein
MKVVVPFSLDSRMLEAVRIALFHERVKPECKLMEGDFDYYELVKSLWAAGEPFIICEHDIVPWPGALAKLDDCPQPWCTFKYRSSAGWINDGLGLVKFNPAQLPNIFKGEFDQKHWSNLDVQIARRLQAHLIHPCTHSPAVTNLNPLMWHVSAQAA